MQMPQPTDGHRQLERLTGRWVGAETMHPSQWDPEGSQADGVTESRVALGGFAVIADYEQRRDGAVTFSGHGVYTYDPEQDLVRLHWFGSMGASLEVFTGRFNGDVLVITDDGPGMHRRLTYDLSTPGKMGSAMEMSPDGSEWTLLFEAVYRKQ